MFCGLIFAAFTLFLDFKYVFFSADQETGPGPGDYDIETSIGKGLSKTIGELPPVDDGCRSYSHNVIQNVQDKNLDICFKNIHACKYTSKLFVFILDPRAPPPNVYVIPDLMGSTMAPHKALVNWRPFTPERKFQFKIIYIISKCIASVRNQCHQTRDCHTLQPLPFGCLKNFTLLLVVARAG